MSREHLTRMDFELSKSLKQKLYRLSIEQDKSMSAIIRNAIRSEVRKHECKLEEK